MRWRAGTGALGRWIAAGSGVSGRDSERTPRAALGLATDAVVLAVWLTAAFATVEYAGGDRYPGYYLLWTGVLLAVGLAVTLAVFTTAMRRVGRLAAIEPLAAALCILFAAALSLNVGPAPRGATGLSVAKLLVLGGSVALVAWNLRRARVSRLSLGAAMAVMCLAWILCGLLRSADLPRTLARLSILVPPATAAALLLPGLPRLDPVMSRFGRWATLVAAAVLSLLPLSPRVPLPTRLAAHTAAPPAGGRSALLIVLDTLRRDHMSLYGYRRRTTPRLERRASGGLVFDDATSVACWTLPSHASMFTGLWPSSHGAHGFPARKGQPINVYPLPRESLTIAEIAREHGYRTAGFTANHFYLSSRFGIEQGFEEYLCRRPRRSSLQLRKARDLARRWDARRATYEEKPYFTAPEMTRAALAWLERHRDSPFFLFLNYMDAHEPNATPGSQGLRFEDEAFGIVEKREQILAAALAPAEQRSLINEYDREVLHLDQWVGVLLDYLERSGLGASTLVVLTSDHGEFLGERNFRGHGKDLYAETVNVPLIVWEPGMAPGRVSRQVQSLDLFPTILRYLRLPIPEGTQGQPLLDVDHPVVSEEHYSHGSDHQPRFDRILRTIRVGEHRYFLSSTGEERLFHVKADPREAHNLISELPGVARSARARLEEWTLATAEAPAPAQPPGIEDEEVLESLRSLGYVR